jgi:hypothetical protein
VQFELRVDKHYKPEENYSVDIVEEVPEDTIFEINKSIQVDGAGIC